jgi:hypothetical protein
MSIVVLRDIVNKTNIAEARKGLQILDLDMEDILNDEDNPLKADDDDPEGAMSQLVALLTEGEGASKKSKKIPRSKTDPIQAILASTGVLYTHENSEVIGSSRVEAQLSRRALETGNDVDVGEERLFDESQQMVAQPGKTAYEFNPPEDVMIRQFCTMARMFGFASATDFALVVENWSQKQRTHCLENFYMKRRERIADLEMEPMLVEDSDDEL